MTTTTQNQNGLEVLLASFAKGDTGSAVQLKKRGVISPEIELAVLKHQNGEPLRRALEERKRKVVCRSNGRYNYESYEYPDGRKVHHGPYSPPPGDYLKAREECEAADKKWVEALERATDGVTAGFIENGHYVHSTTRRLLLQLALLGYRPRLVSAGGGKYIRLTETYGEYRYQDVIKVDASVNLNGSESYKSAEQSTLFGSSGSRNTWTIRADGRTVDVTCWH